VGRSKARSLESRLTVLLTHLLKWQFQPGRRSSGWLRTIAEQRQQIAHLTQERPSLASLPKAALDRCYRSARKEAAAQTRLASSVFPSVCPYTLEQVAERKYLPEFRK
jgi:hypothetical protein